MITKPKELSNLFSGPWTEITFFRVNEDGFQGDWMGYIPHPGSIDLEASIAKRDYPGARFVIISAQGEQLYESDERDKDGVFLRYGEPGLRRRTSHRVPSLLAPGHRR